jgi:hypothetical protein
MKPGWRRVTRFDPCPVCGKPDWCCVGEQSGDVYCMRVPSDHPIAAGGWLHRRQGVSKSNVAEPPQNHRGLRLSPLPDNAKCGLRKIFLDNEKSAYKDHIRSVMGERSLAAVLERWQKNVGVSELEQLSEHLGLASEPLKRLGVGWASEFRAWAFPMRSCAQALRGIRLRTDAGRKFAVRGGHEGLFFDADCPSDVVCVCEGPTDTAAALALGYFAIGKPSCQSCHAEVASMVAMLAPRQIVIAADADGPGWLGALRTAEAIARPCTVWTPPVKDLREFVRAGGTREMIDCAVRDLEPIMAKNRRVT